MHHARRALLARTISGRAFGWGARIAVSILCIALLFAQIDPGALIDTWAKLSKPAIAAVGALHLLILLIIGLRWHLLVIAFAARPRFRDTLGLSCAGTFFNLVLPFNIAGDALRVVFGPQRAIPRAAALASVVLDRIAGFAGLGALILIVSPFFGTGGVPAALLAVLVALVPLSAALIGAIVAAVRRWPHAASRLSEIAGIRLRVLGSRSIAALMLAVCCHALAAWAMTLIVRDLGFELGAGQGLLLFPGILLAGMLPVSFGGWGARELAAAALLGLAGVPVEAAVTVTLLFTLVQTIVAALGSLIWILADRQRAAHGRA